MSDHQPSETTPRETDEPATSLKMPAKHALTPEQKCLSWLNKGLIEDVESTLSSSVTARHYWMDRQTDVVARATRHLHHRAGVKEITEAVKKDKECQRHKISETFTRQQIRDKFKNICKKR